MLIEPHVPTLQELRAKDENHIMNVMERKLGDRDRNNLVLHIGKEEMRRFRACFQETGNKLANTDKFLGVVIKEVDKPGVEVVSKV